MRPGSLSPDDPITVPRGRLPQQAWLAAGWALVLLIVAAIYLPVLHAGFVWDDLINFQDMAWLRQGDAWKHYVFRGFNNWSNYFRPLVVAFYVVELRASGGAPGLMHGVSLGLHLLNLCLLGKLATGALPDAPRWRQRALVLLSMLAYGVHPSLTEAVTWIGCQFDLVQTALTLASLLASLGIQRIWPRTLTLALLFFLAACAKESAAVLPVLVVLFDWVRRTPPDAGLRQRIGTLLRGNWSAYTGMVLAGVCYLLLRSWALGALIPAQPKAAPADYTEWAARIAFLYTRYWQLIAGLGTQLSPVHPWAEYTFGTFTPAILARMLGSLGLIALGLWRICSPRPMLGLLLLSASAALLPVLHVVPMQFDSSLYHDRYAMTALALTAALAPAAVLELRAMLPPNRLLVPIAALLYCIWLAGAVLNVRVTIPLWSSNVKLWEWAAAGHPVFVDAQDNLLSAYMDAGMHDQARGLVARMEQRNLACDNCKLNAAILALQDGKADRARWLLDAISHAPVVREDPQTRRYYLRTRGQLELQSGHAREALNQLAMARDIDPYDPFAELLTAMAYAQEGNLAQAGSHGAKALALATPEDRAGISASLKAASIKPGPATKPGQE